jgi:predicted TIM-barrel fold metal-dependent hydrolase
LRSPLLPLASFALALSVAGDAASDDAASPAQILLRDYRPVSIHRVPVTRAARAKGARGVGEEGDKGLGMGFGRAKGLHLDDARLSPLLDRCAALGLPVNVHVADPIWMYQPMDATNDGLTSTGGWTTSPGSSATRP